MKKTLFLFAFTLLVAVSGAFAADPQGQACLPALSAAPAEAAPAPSAPSLEELLGVPRPSERSDACYDQAYQDCLNYCYDHSQNNRCDFYASQLCLCMRAPADCPLCY